MEWRVISEFPNYCISDTGEVRNSKRGTIVKPRIDRCGYLCLQLYKNNKRWFKRINRLVAQAFIPNPENKPEVNHKNTNKQDNEVNNLEWVTGDENIKHAKDHNLLCKTSKPVVQYTLEGVYIKEYESITKAAESVNRHFSSIRACCVGLSDTSAGYVWRFKDVN